MQTSRAVAVAGAVLVALAGCASRPGAVAGGDATGRAVGKAHIGSDASMPLQAAPAKSQVSPDGGTPLEAAVYKGDVAGVQRLLREGADVKATNEYGASAMQLAAETGNTPILKLLLRAGADVDSVNEDGQTALMAVARTGNVEAAKLLISHGAKVDTRENWGGQTALMWAAARRHPEMMKVLISHGAKVNERSTVRDYKRHITAEGRAKDVNTGGLTPLMFAARENCLECVNVLLAHRVDVDMPDPDGVAPVTVAILNGNWDVAKRLIEAGADVNQWDIYGQAPLYAAVDMGNVVSGGRASIDTANQTTARDVVRLLLERGANPNMQLFYRPANRVGMGWNILISRGTTPLIRAAANDDVETVKLLLAHGADPRLKQADDQTPMMAALCGRRGGGTEDDAVEVLKVLHAAGADVNVVAKMHHLARTRGGTALHYATRQGWTKAMKELISYGADVNLKDFDGLTALDYAMARGYIPFLGQKMPVRQDVVAVLRDHGATVELVKAPDWPPVGPPIGYEATIWPL
jgi:ankyrin repeat protein